MAVGLLPELRRLQQALSFFHVTVSPSPLESSEGLNGPGSNPARDLNRAFQANFACGGLKVAFQSILDAGRNLPMIHALDEAVALQVPNVGGALYNSRNV